MVRADQKSYRRKTISSFKDKPKKFYSYMRQTQTVKVQVSQLEKEGGSNALNINSFHLPTKFSQPANLTIYIILSLFSLQVEPAPHLLSP